MAAIEDSEGNTAEKNLTDQTFMAGVTSDIDLTDLTFYVLKVGDYVYKDGTTGTEFVAHNTVAKVFWLGDPTEQDTQLGVDYSYCTHGLAYKIDDEGSIEIIPDTYGTAPATTWGAVTSTIITYDNYSSYTNENNIHGYSNTVAIKTDAKDGFISAVSPELPVIEEKTSSWYIPSIGEIKEINNIYPDVFGIKQLWTSTIYQWINKQIKASYYVPNTNMKNDGSSTYTRCYSFYILAF